MFAFLEQYVPNELDASYGLYGAKCGEVVFGGQKFRTFSSPQEIFMMFRTPSFEQCESGLKFHIPVAENQMEKALPIIAKIVGRHQIGMFKVRQNAWTENTGEWMGNRYQGKQEGKDFTIGVSKGKDTPDRIQSFLNDLEEALAQARITRPKMVQIGPNLKKGDKKVTGSNYCYYRYDRPNGDGKYIPARCGFKAPAKGDMMEWIAVYPTLNNAVPYAHNRASSAPSSRANKSLWQTAVWRVLPERNKKGSYVITSDLEGMSPVHQHKFFHELKSLNIHFDVQIANHRDGHESNVVVISPESQDYFIRLHGVAGIENAGCLPQSQNMNRQRSMQETR